MGHGHLVGVGLRDGGGALVWRHCSHGRRYYLGGWLEHQRLVVDYLGICGWVRQVCEIYGLIATMLLYICAHHPPLIRILYVTIY